jgi:hypothetical protein
MMIKKPKRARRRKVRYRTIKLKLTAGQHRSLEQYCEARRTTPVKFIKKLLKPRLGYSGNIPEENYATANQLDLFGGSTILKEV